jgi:hypothetical protein
VDQWTATGIVASIELLQLLALLELQLLFMGRRRVPHGALVAMHGYPRLVATNPSRQLASMVAL